MELPKSTITKEQEIAMIKDKINRLENSPKDNVNIQKKLMRRIRILES